MKNYPKALLFDLNGTMINDMDFHSRAWYQILNNDLGGNFSMAEVKQNMYGKNQELLVRMFGDDRFTQQEMDQLSVVILTTTHQQSEFNYLDNILHFSLDYKGECFMISYCNKPLRHYEL